LKFSPRITTRCAILARKFVRLNPIYGFELISTLDTVLYWK